MNELRIPEAVLVLCGLLCVALTSCDRSTGQKPDAKVLQRANATLSGVELPVLPEEITDLRYWAGGVFAKFINIKFTTSREQALDYFQRAGATCYLEFAEREDQHRDIYRVLATHFLGESHEGAELPDSTELNMIDRAGRRWFESVYEIRHGWYYYSERDGRLWECELYYDLDTQVFYLYWHYS